MTLINEPRQVRLGTRTMPYMLKVSTRAKRMRVTIANGKMSVTVPSGLRLYSVDRFLQEHGQWILAKMEQVVKAQGAANPAKGCGTGAGGGDAHREGRGEGPQKPGTG